MMSIPNDMMSIPNDMMSIPNYSPVTILCITLLRNVEVIITILLICISQSIINIIYRINYINIMESTVHIIQNCKSNGL